MKKGLSAVVSSLKNRFSTLYKRSGSFINRHPFLSLFLLLIAIFVIIAIGNFIRTVKAVQTKETTVTKNVSIYQIGAVPRIKLQAQIEKSSVITVTALMGGVVQNIGVTEGQAATQGQTLVSLSTNYQGGNVFSLQRQIAQNQYDNINSTYDEQKSIIDSQRDIATATHVNFEDLQSISAQSVGETQSLLDYNNNILSGLDSLISYYQSQPSTPTLQQTIISLENEESQLKSGNNQLNSSLRNLNYQTDTSKPPTELADLQKDLTLKQLDLQEETLKMNREISRLQYQIALVNEALMYPSAPFSGTVQKVFVRVGQNVNPGDPLAVLSGVETDDPISAIVYAPREVAQTVSRTEAATLSFGGNSYQSLPSFVSTEAVQGDMYAIYFPIPSNYSSMLTDKGYIDVELPIGYPDTNAVIPFIPIDAVYQSENASYVFVLQSGKAESRTVDLGQVLGRFVQVHTGLGQGDQVILDRTVVAGDSVKAVR